MSLLIFRLSEPIDEAKLQYNWQRGRNVSLLIFRLSEPIDEAKLQYNRNAF